MYIIVIGDNPIFNNMNDEIWANIPGYEGYYMVSNLGRVKSLARKTNNQYCKTDRILVPGWIRKKNSYKFVCLTKNGTCKKALVHRLVAEAFIPNPDNLPQVNHKDCNPENNRADNLEWCSSKYNVNYGDRNKKCSKSLSVPVKQYTLKGEFVASYPSATIASKKTGVWLQNICKCRAGNLPSAGGYKWTY